MQGALMDDRPRNAYCVAGEEGATVMVLAKPDFQAVKDQLPKIQATHHLRSAQRKHENVVAGGHTRSKHRPAEKQASALFRGAALGEVIKEDELLAAL
jgi:hypothetical protein